MVETKPGKPGKASDIGFPQQVARKIAIATLSPVMRSEIRDPDNSIKKLKDYLKMGYGAVIISNHFSSGDPVRLVELIFRHRTIGSRQVVAPIAYHMDKPVYHRIGKPLGIKLDPIVTESTIKANKNDGRTLGDGKRQFTRDSLEFMSIGGVVILLPQETREETLGKPKKNAIGALIKVAEAKGIKLVLLVVGLGIKGVDDYSNEKIRGINPTKGYTVVVGSCLTDKELLGKAGGDYRRVDKIEYEELNKVVPDAQKNESLSQPVSIEG